MAAFDATSGGERPVAAARASWWAVAGYLLLSVLPIVGGVGIGIPESQVLAPSSIYAQNEIGYGVPVAPSVLSPVFEALGDDADHPQRSSARLVEDGKVLGPPHMLHALIAAVGGGLYSHWGDSLLFSASDSSDPRRNGRRYELHLQSRLPFMASLIWVLCFAAGALRPPRHIAAGRGVSMTVIVAGVVSSALALASVVFGVAVASASVVLATWLVALAVSYGLAIAGGRLLATRPVDLTPLLRLERAVAARVDPVLEPLDRIGPAWRLARLATLSAGAAPFWWVVYHPWPAAWLERLHDDHAVLFCWGVPIFVLALWRRGWFGVAATVALVLVAVAFPLAARWQDVSVHGNATGGLLPYSDARGYWLEANRLLDGVPLDWAARRPAFTAFLSTLFALTGRNLEWSLVFLAAMNAAAIALMGLELRRSLGPPAGAVAIVVLVAFYGFDGGLGTTLTENIGLAVAALGFAAMVRGTRVSQPAVYATGVGLVAFALMARAGAFFVLPALVLAAAWEFRQRWLRAAALVMAATVVAAVVSVGSGRLLSAPAGDQQAFSNFSYSLYGLVVGGKGWQQVVREHPEAREGAEIYALAWQAFKARPAGLVEGAGRMWATYVDVTSTSAYHAFVFIKSASLPKELTTFCYLAAGLGLLLAVGGINQSLRPTLVAGIVGHVASIPFVPPIDAGLRVYAATMPFIAALVALGAAAPAAALVRLIAGPRPATPEPAGRVEWPHASVATGMVIVLATTLVPQALLRVGRSTEPPAVQCGPGQVALAVRVSPGAQLDIVGDEASTTAPTRLRVASLRRTLAMAEIADDLTGVAPGQSLVAAYEVRASRSVWILAPTGVVPGPGVYSTCGVPASDPAAHRFDLYFGGPRWLAASAP